MKTYLISALISMMVGCAASPAPEPPPPKPMMPALRTAPCATNYGTVMETLRTRYGEHLKFVGSNNAILFSIYINVNNGTWTITVTDPNRTCILAAGQAWRAVQPVEKGPEL